MNLRSLKNKITSIMEGGLDDTAGEVNLEVSHRRCVKYDFHPKKGETIGWLTLTFDGPIDGISDLRPIRDAFEGKFDISSVDEIEGDKIILIARITDDIVEVAPPGGEKVVKALKKNKGVDNPYAVAWSMKNKGNKFKK